MKLKEYMHNMFYLMRGIARATPPYNMETRKSKIAYFVFRQWYIFSQGRGQVLGRVLSPSTEVFALIAYIEFYTPVSLNWFTVLLVVFAGLIFCWASGVVWMAYDLDRIESYVSLDRSQFQKEMYNNIVKERESL